MDPQMKRGFVEACVLASVCGGESYGYEIIRNVPQALGLKEATLYPVLKRLEKAGQVSVRSAEHNGRLRKYYLATEAGREALERFRAERIEVRAVYDYIETAIKAGGTGEQS